MKYHLKRYNPVHLPRGLYITGETITFAGCWNRLNIPQDANTIELSAEGGVVYYAINAEFAIPASPGYVPMGGRRIIGPLGNLRNVYVNADADVIVRVRYYTNGGTSEVEPFTYADKVLNYCPIAYWILGEEAGVTAVDQVNSPAQDGTYTGVTLGQPGIGDGETAPLFDGTNDFVDIYSAALNAAFNGAECTIAIWSRVANAGVWTDGSFRTSLILFVDVNNSILLRRTNINGVYSFEREGGGVVTFRQRLGESTADWFFAALTISESADEMRAYWNGVQEGATINGLGVWAGNFNPLLCLIGAQNQVPANVWSGLLGRGALYNRALPPAAIADLATV